MLNKYQKKEVRLINTGLLTYACGKCTTPKECDDCPVQRVMQMMNKQLINDPDWNERRHKLTLSAYIGLKKKGEKDREIREMYNMTRQQLSRFKRKEGIQVGLSEEDVIEIRRLRAQGVFYKNISAKFGISEGYASEIARGIKFPEVEEEIITKEVEKQIRAKNAYCHNLTKDVYECLREEGKLDNEICEMYSISRHQLYRFKKKEGITSKGGKRKCVK